MKSSSHFNIVLSPWKGQGMMTVIQSIGERTLAGHKNGFDREMLPMKPKFGYR